MATSAPHLRHISFYANCLALIMGIIIIITFQSIKSKPIKHLGLFNLAAAIIPRPIGPHPDTTTVSSGWIMAKFTACIEQASGSMNVPFHGGMDLGTYKTKLYIMFLGLNTSLNLCLYT